MDTTNLLIIRTTNSVAVFIIIKYFISKTHTYNEIK